MTPEFAASMQLFSKDPRGVDGDVIISIVQMQWAYRQAIRKGDG